jgi:hypothetical protein
MFLRLSGCNGRKRNASVSITNVQEHPPKSHMLYRFSHLDWWLFFFSFLFFSEANIHSASYTKQLLYVIIGYLNGINIHIYHSYKIHFNITLPTFIHVDVCIKRSKPGYNSPFSYDSRNLSSLISSPQ